jgi:NAD(P)-dependent dehydrogenase (short-subunit alcohol dehydrogenase family)
LAGRSESKISPVISRIPTPAEFIALDLADQASVHSAAAAVAARTQHIDVLINSAAVMAMPSMQTTPQGIEEQFGVNHIGHFLLTNLLRKHGVQLGRVVNVTSTAFTLEEVRFGDVNFEARVELRPEKEGC